MSKHIPRPWIWDRNDLVSEQRDALGNNHFILSAIGGGAENRALIAAAPDLLAACEAILACEEEEDIGGYVAPEVRAKAIETIRAAIAKARGGQ